MYRGTTVQNRAYNFNSSRKLCATFMYLSQLSLHNKCSHDSNNQVQLLSITLYNSQFHKTNSISKGPPTISENIPKISPFLLSLFSSFNHQDGFFLNQFVVKGEEKFHKAVLRDNFKKPADGRYFFQTCCVTLYQPTNETKNGNSYVSGGNQFRRYQYVYNLVNGLCQDLFIIRNISLNLGTCQEKIYSDYNYTYASRNRLTYPEEVPPKMLGDFKFVCFHPLDSLSMVNNDDEFLSEPRRWKRS